MQSQQRRGSWRGVAQFLPVRFGAISAVLSIFMGLAPTAIAKTPSAGSEPWLPPVQPPAQPKAVRLEAAEPAPAAGAIALPHSAALRPAAPAPYDSGQPDSLGEGPVPGAASLLPSLQVRLPPPATPRVATTRLSQAPPPADTAPPSPDASDSPGDPELGILRLRELPEATLELEDPELGRLRLRQTVLRPRADRPAVFFTARTSGFWSDNIFSFTDAIGDGILQSGISLRAVPALGDRTFLTAAVEGNLVRYFDQTEFSYNELELQASLFRAITRRAYVDLGWNHQQLFERDGGERFFSDHELRLAVGRRDRLGDRLDFNTSYQLQLSFADPQDRSRIINRLNASLSYDITSRLRSDLFYQFSLIDFTRRDRNDYYHQMLAQFTYSLSSETRVFLYGGGRLGGSSDDRINFDGLLFGVGLVFNFSLF